MFFADWDGILRVIVVGALAYLAVLVLLRIYGKRTLAKMNAFDFVVTVALGSTLAGVLLNRDIPLAEAITAFVVLLTLQLLISWLSVRSALVRRKVKSDPALLVRRGKMIRAALRSERVTEGEARQAARQAGVSSLADVEALLLESDGSFSVIRRSVVGARSARLSHFVRRPTQASPAGRTTDSPANDEPEMEPMNDDQLQGKAKEEWGDVTDDASTEMEGKAEQWSGEAKERSGNAADAVSGRDEGEESH